MNELRIGFILDLSREDKEVAQRELGEDDKQTTSRIVALREALQQRKHFVTRQDDAFLLMFLRRALFSQTRALDTIENFTRNRVTNPYSQIYINAATLDARITDIQLTGCHFLLPGIPSSGARVAVLKCGAVDYSKYSLMDVLRAAMVNLDIIIKDPVAQVRGLDVVVDFTNVGLRILPHMTLETIRVAAETLVSTCPWQMIGLHCINMPRIVNAAVLLFKTFLSKEKADIIHVHSSPGRLHSFINPEVLPEELGGTAGRGDELVKKFHQHVVANLEELGLYSRLRYDQTPTGHEGSGAGTSN